MVFKIIFIKACQKWCAFLYEIPVNCDVITINVYALDQLFNDGALVLQISFFKNIFK